MTLTKKEKKKKHKAKAIMNRHPEGQVQGTAG